MVEFLPGIFYVYVLNEKNFDLIHWNKNHETITGYSAQELKHKCVYDFFYPADYSVIEGGLGEIIETGAVKQVSADLKLKNGKTLPFLFEGYRFYSGENLCFMGVGIDMTVYIETKKKLALAKAKMNSIKQELQKKERELLSFALDKTKELRIEAEFKKRIQQIVKKNPTEIKESLLQLEKEFKTQTNEYNVWEVFKLRFIEVHPNFFKNLQKKHHNLTHSELRICAYLKMKMSAENMSGILNISKEGVKKSRYRLRKKMELSRNIPLDDYIDTF
ncbi:MAG: PAS domain-containing protein [Lutimonas sp.]